jgi:predicted permease
MLSDLHYAIRQLLKSPTFSVISVVTIAVGIGANTAVFSVMNAVLLRFLPVPNPQQLVLFHLRNQPLSTNQSGYDDTSLSLPVFQAMRANHTVFSDVVAFAPLSFGKVTVRFGAEPEQANGEIVSGNYFSGLGVQPLIGRGFTLQDELHNAPLAVLSYRWWTSRFHASRDILGQTLYLKGLPFTIVGIAPPGFDGADPGQPEMDFWVPLQKSAALNPWGEGSDLTLYGSRNWLCLLVIGRLKPGIPSQKAATALTPLFRRTLAAASPIDARDRKPEIVFSDVRGIETLRQDYEHPLHILMMMVALVLLIASANVAMLLLLRNAAKEREFALRRALGASGRVLFGYLFTESFLLVTAGCILAWPIARTGTQALSRWSGLEFAIEPDRQVLLFTLAISVLVALAFGLVPMRVVNSLPLALTLRSSTATANTDRRRFWGRKVVVALQIAMCAVLLFGGELLYATLRNLEASDLGMRTAGVLVFGITPQSNIRTDAEAARLHLRILQALRALPGVDHATVSLIRLGSGGSSNNGILVDGRNPLPSKPIAPARANMVGSDFFHTLGIPLQLGRDFSEADIVGSTKVAIINQTFADRYLPHLNPLGHQIAPFDTPKSIFTIVGVARNSRYTGVKEHDAPTAYVPFTQVPGISEMQYEVHTLSDPKAIVPQATRIVHEIDPNVPLEKPITQREQFETTISQQRLIARLSICFGVLAMFLVLVGLYGTISYSISRRTMEIGVRMALGAQRREVLGMVLRESGFLALLGVVIGLPIAFALGRTLQSMLFGLSAADPIACLAALTGIVFITLAATFIPARRAASIDPQLALRAE